MKTSMLITAAALTIGVGSAQADVRDYTPEQIKEMPRFSSIEQQRFRCTKASGSWSQPIFA